MAGKKVRSPLPPATRQPLWERQGVTLYILGIGYDLFFFFFYSILIIFFFLLWMVVANG